MEATAVRARYLDGALSRPPPEGLPVVDGQPPEPLPPPFEPLPPPPLEPLPIGLSSM